MAAILRSNQRIPVGSGPKKDLLTEETFESGLQMAYTMKHERERLLHEVIAATAASPENRTAG